MFGTIRKHQKWLWVVIITLTIISFVIFFSPNQPQLRNLFGGGSGEFGKLDGRPITRDQLISARRQVELYHTLFSDNRSVPEDMDREMLEFLFLNSKVHDLKIQVSDAEVAAWIQQNLRNPETGQVNYDPL